MTRTSSQHPNHIHIHMWKLFLLFLFIFFIFSQLSENNKLHVTFTLVVHLTTTFDTLNFPFQWINFEWMDRRTYLCGIIWVFETKKMHCLPMETFYKIWNWLNCVKWEMSSVWNRFRLIRTYFYESFCMKMNDKRRKTIIVQRNEGFRFQKVQTKEVKAIFFFIIVSQITSMANFVSLS